jgi:hypothetical protein
VTSWQDAFNAFLEFAAVFAVLASVRKLVRDRKVRGLAPSHMAYGFFSASWFLYYYAHLDQWWSFWVSALYWFTFAAWVVLALYFYWIRGVVCGDDDQL